MGDARSLRHPDLRVFNAARVLVQVPSITYLVGRGGLRPLEPAIAGMIHLLSIEVVLLGLVYVFCENTGDQRP